MSYPFPPSLAATVVAVAPTTTILATTTAREDSLTSVQIENLDASQTFVGYVQRRLQYSNEFATSTLPDLSDIPPLTSVVADLDSASAVDIRIIGTMSGAGGDVRITVRNYQR